MALSRSASGPGGLSINTSSANLFGSSSSQPPAAGGLFGSTSTSTSQPQTMSTGTSLFGNAAASTPKPGGLSGNATATTAQPQQTGGGLFGNTAAAATSQPQTGGGLFGNAATAATTTPQQQPAAGGLFGQAGATAAKPGGLFGSTPAAQPQQQTGLGGGLFGNTANTNTIAPATAAGGLFGASTATAQPQQQQQQQPALGAGLFGSNIAAQQSSNQTGGNIWAKGGFGSSTAQQQPQPSGLFGASGLAGSLSTGPALGAASQPTVVPGVRIDVTNVHGTTRFNDLQDDLQKQIAEVDKIIQGYIQQKNEIDAFMPAHGEMLNNIPNDVKFLERKYDGVRSALESDAQAIDAAYELVKQDAESARLSFRATDNMKLPSQYHTSGLWSGRQQNSGSANNETDGQDLVGLFSKTAEEMGEQLERYKKNVAEIDMHMNGVHASLTEQLQKMMAAKNGGLSGTDEKLAELGAVLRDFELSILKVAGEVGSLREDMTQLQLGDFLKHSIGERNGVY